VQALGTRPKLLPHRLQQRKGLRQSILNLSCNVLIECVVECVPASAWAACATAAAPTPPAQMPAETAHILMETDCRGCPNASGDLTHEANTAAGTQQQTPQPHQTLWCSSLTWAIVHRSHAAPLTGSCAARLPAALCRRRALQTWRWKCVSNFLNRQHFVGVVGKPTPRRSPQGWPACCAAPSPAGPKDYIAHPATVHPAVQHAISLTQKSLTQLCNTRYVHRCGRNRHLVAAVELKVES